MRIIHLIFRYLLALCFVAVTSAALGYGMLELLKKYDYLDKSPVEKIIYQWHQNNTTRSGNGESQP